MSRPAKYKWDSIREAYEKGFDKDEIVKKFDVSKAMLTNRINVEKWVILCDVNSDIAELSAKSSQIAQNYTQNPDIAEMFEHRINTIAQDNELISNNRKILKAFQSILGKGVRDNIFKTPQDIRAGVGAIKDIESIANPQASRLEINNTNAQQNNQPTQIIIKRDS